MSLGSSNTKGNFLRLGLVQAQSLELCSGMKRIFLFLFNLVFLINGSIGLSLTKSVLFYEVSGASE